MKEVFVEQTSTRLSIQAPGIGKPENIQKVIALLQAAIAALQSDTNRKDTYLNEISIKK